MHYKIAQLILTPGKKANTTSDIFIAQPDTAKEAMFGKIFILAEVDDNSADAVKIINFIFDEINRNYYHNEKILLAEKIARLKPEHIFEATLAKTNINLLEFMQDSKIRINFGMMNFTAGLIHEKNFHFANTGRNKVLFVYRQKLDGSQKNDSRTKKTITGIQNAAESYKYKVADITKQTVEPILSGEENKLFTDVISGQILDSSSFFISNEAFPEYISNKQLIDIVTTLPPTSAVEQFKLILSNINSYIAFLGILVKSTALEKSDDSRKYIIQSSQESITSLNDTETATENLLSPSGLIDAKKWLVRIKSLLPWNAKFIKNSETSLSLKDKIFFKKKSLAIFNFKKILAFSNNIAAHLINSLFSLAKLLASREKLTNFFSSLPLQISQKWKKLFQAIGSLSKKNKILLAVSVSCLIFFAINLTVLKNKNSQEEKNNEIKNITTLIEQKQNQAEANLLYNNEDGAKKLFAEIEALMNKYPQSTDEQKTQFSEFKKKYEDQLGKIRKIESVNDPVVLVDFKNLASAANPENIILNNTSDKIYSGDSGQKSIYIYNLKDKQSATLADLKQLIESLRYPAINGENFIYYLNNKNLIRLDVKKDELASLVLPVTEDLTAPAGIGFYNENLYVIDSGNGQIYKFDKNGESFLKPKKWLKDSTDLKGAVDLVVDGNIYILKSNGEIIKLLRGGKVDFSLGLTEPALNKPAMMHFSPDLNFIYILEPQNKRLILFDKTGKFLMQYYSDKFTDLKSFATDEKNKIIYVLNGTEILSFKATHL